MITRHLWGWIVVLTFSFLLMPYFSPRSEIEENVIRDMEGVTRFFGEKSGKVVIDAADRINAAFTRKIVDAATKPFFYSKSEVREIGSDAGGGGRTLALWMHEYFSSMRASTYIYTLRALVCLMVYLYTLPFMLAAVVDGVVSLKIRSASGGRISYDNPNKYHMAQHGVIMASCGPLLYFLLPWLRFEPLVFFFWAAALLSSISMTIKHFPASARS